MAIKIRRPTSDKSSAVKEFTDRTEPRTAFWNRYMKMIKEGSTIISFYGAGGVGKTALLKQIEDEIKHYNDYIKTRIEGNNTNHYVATEASRIALLKQFEEELKKHDEYKDKQCKYIKYDFSLGTDLREVLKTLKFQLSDYGCEFPFFESGNYYYSLKVGQDITPLKAKSLTENIPFIKNLNKRLYRADDIAWRASPFLRVARGSVELVDEIFQATSIPRLITTCFSIVDSLLKYYMEENGVSEDEVYKAVHEQLNIRREEKNPIALYEYLPTLFAMDVVDWMKKTSNKLIVILDNYESLISETGLSTTEQLKRDLWLRGNEGLIFMLPNTLWTIAGRNKLRWKGELADELEQHLINELSPEDADWFLSRAGIEDKTLRDGLVQLTEGYPIFLDLCVDTYFEYKRRYNAEPSIAEFGQKREEVVGRILRYLDAEKDDAAKDMLEFLCVLNLWTDELAKEIGRQTLPNFSHNTYKRVKDFSFIKKESFELLRDEDTTTKKIDIELYRFDKTIHSIFIETCDKKLISDVKTIANEYFKKLFAYKKIFNPKEILYLKLWIEFIVQFNEADKILEQYQDILSDKISFLTNTAQFDTSEEILKLIMSKLESLNATDTTSFTYFEMNWGWLKRSQGKYKEAYVITNSCYEKRLSLLGIENNGTVDAMHKLAISLIDLGRYDEAVTIQNQVLTLRKELLGAEHPDIILAMNALAVSLNNLSRYLEAKNFLEQALTLSKKILGNKNQDITIMVLNNLAISLNNLGRYSEAKNFLEQALNLSKESVGNNHLDDIAIMNNLAISLDGLKLYDAAIDFRRKALNLSKEILGNEHSNTLATMNNLALSLIERGFHAEAKELLEQALTLSKEILGNEHSNTLATMNNLALSLNNLGHHAEAKKLLEISKNNVSKANTNNTKKSWRRTID